jgi:glycosyltransferase 2 family protein
MSRKSLWRVLQWLAVLLILFFWGRAVRNNWSVLTGYPWHISPTWLVLSLVILGAQALLLAALWRRLLALCGEVLPRRQGDALWLQSQLARYLPGGVWEVATRVLMGRRLGIGALVMSAVYGLELTLQILSAGVFFGAALALRSERPPTSYLALIVVLVLASLLVLLPPIFNPLVRWGLRVLKRPAVPVQVTYRASLGLFAAYMLAHALSGLGFVSFLRGVGPLPWSEALQLALAYVGAWLVGQVAIFVPTGIGVREGALGLLLGNQYPLVAVATLALGFRLLIALRDLIMAFYGRWLDRHPSPPEDLPDEKSTVA